jgi:NitT/TauT family transport system substrate-binding protein
MDKIRVGYASNAVGTAPVWTACDAGYFKALGLEVEPVLIRGSAAVTRAIEKGEVEFGNFAAPAAIQANVERDADLVLILGAMNRVMQALSGRPGITTLEQLRGGAIGINSKTEVNFWILKAILPRIGFVEGQDVRIEEIGRGHHKEWHTDAKVDALVLHPPQPFEAAADGWTTLLDTRTLGLPFQLSCICGRRDWIAGHREMIQRYVQGHVEGLLRFNNDRAMALEVQKKWGPTDDRDILIRTHEFAKGEFSERPFPTEIAIRNILEAMRWVLPKADPDKAGDYIDDSFVAALEKSGKLMEMTARYAKG